MNIKKHSFFIVLTFVISANELLAQLDNSALFYNNRDMSQIEVGDLDLEIYGLGFNKNNEYYEKTATGYTFFGYFFRPELAYHMDTNFSVKIGMAARKDFGNLDFTLIQPTFSLQYRYKPFRFIFGTIEGPLEHNYVEPIYDFERIVTDNPENGLQIFFESKSFKTDAWISWNKMIYDRSPFREEFNGGVNINWRVINGDHIEIKLPFQSIATHVGGQIDDDPNPARTVTNFLGGTELKTKFGKGFFNTIEFKGYYLTYYSLESESLIPPFRDGDAYYLNLLFTTHLGDFMISYWQGNEYSSWNGGHLYQSTSKNWREPLALQQDREVLILRFLNDIKIRKDLRVVPRFEPYWNLNDGQFGFSMGLYIKFQNYFKLLNAKASSPN